MGTAPAPSGDPLPPPARRRCVHALALILLAWLVPACSDSARPAPSGGAAPRIVVLSPALAVTLRDLGLDGLIVGKHAYDLVLGPAIPSCGDQSGLEYEAILRVSPTHLLLERGASAVPARLESLARTHGWTIRTFPLLALDDIEHSATGLWQEFVSRRAGRSDSGARIDPETFPLADQFARAFARRGTGGAGGFDGVGRVLLLGALDPPGALGPGSFHHQILERIGGVPALDRGGPFMTLDTEDILRLTPDAIVLILPRPPGAPASPPAAESLRQRLGRVGELDIPAVRAGRIALIDDPLAHTPSTAMIGLADALARILKGWGPGGGDG